MDHKNTDHGHARRIKGGHSSTYNTWRSMVQRCECEGYSAFKAYGAKGLGVCSTWKDFKVFLKDMGEKPMGMSLDRIDNEKGYSKENCRWATAKTQARNRKNSIYVQFRGEKRLLAEIIEEFSFIKPSTVIRRIRLGWDIESALFEDVRPGVTPSKRSPCASKSSLLKSSTL